MDFTVVFFDNVKRILNKVEATQKEKIQMGAQVVADTIKNDGIVYTFGTGHSHCVAEEVTYRAGSLAPIDAILEPSLTGTTDVVKSEQLERIEGISRVILEHRRVTSRDCMIIISNSGRNGAPIEMAIECKKKGIPTIAITSLEYAKNVASRHSSGKKLYEVADIVIDNCGVFGDATVYLEGSKVPMGSTSNIIGNCIIHAITIEAAQILIKNGIEPPVFLSGNLDNCKEVNQKLLDKYWGRIKMW
ncbi:MAG TPA: SIS domain-containing protein [Thermoanaerobacterales bacterium]|nr:SIS domain-containing protein [Thermoanaerobacterales bacterium]